MRTRRARVLHENVECPSISPDNTRVAYKKWVGDTWQLHVLDLATMRETPLAEKRHIDDQVEWLDDERILYGLGTDTGWCPPTAAARPGSSSRRHSRPRSCAAELNRLGPAASCACATGWLTPTMVQRVARATVCGSGWTTCGWIRRVSQ